MSHIKGTMRFGKRGKLSIRHNVLFEIPWTFREVAYKLALPTKFLVIHLIFYVSKLQDYNLDESQVKH